MEQTANKTEGVLPERTVELAQEVMTLMKDFGAKVSEEVGFEVRAGLMAYLRELEGGSFKPDVRVLILPVKTQENETQGKDSTDGGASETDGGSEEPTESPTTTG